MTTTAQRATAVEQAHQLIQSEGLSANKAAQSVAEPLGVAARTVQQWAQDAGRPLGNAAHEAAKQARETAEQEYEARRSALRLRLLGEVEWLLGRIHEPHYAYLGPKVERVEYETAPDGAVRNYVWSAAVLIDKLRLEEGKVQGRTEVVTVDRAAEVLRTFVEEAEAYANEG